MTNEIRYFSMFTGVGGFELGLEANNPQPLPEIEQDQEGRDRTSNEQGALLRPRSIPTFRCVGVSEIDKYSNELLKQKYPNITNYGDCTQIEPRNLPDFDMLCGGFPCQPFSIAGKRKGFEDTRGTMLYEIARILEIKRPKIIFLENVKGLLNHNKGETFKVILQTLAELGYRTQWMVLNSKFFGVPQNRERVFIIGSLRGEPRPEILPFREKCEEFDKSSIESREDGKRIWDYPTNTISQRDYKGGNQLVLDVYNSKIHSDRTPALTEPHHNNIRLIDKMKIRRLTPTECERLQGFPDGWTLGFSDTQRYKMMGNAVTVNVIKAIGERLFANVPVHAQSSVLIQIKTTDKMKHNQSQPYFNKVGIERRTGNSELQSIAIAKSISKGVVLPADNIIK